MSKEKTKSFWLQKITDTIFDTGCTVSKPMVEAVYSVMQEFSQEQPTIKEATSSDNVGKDWEITSVLDTMSNDTYPFNSIDDKGRFKINAVRRKSDGDVFTVGDEVEFRSGGDVDWEKVWLGKIDKIEVSFENNKELVFEIPEEETTNRKYIHNIRKPQPISTKTKLFTTEDGKDIFEGDGCWVVMSDWDVIKLEEARQKLSGEKSFSTQEAAQNFVIENKPCLSLQDLLDWWRSDEEYKQQCLAHSEVFYTNDIKNNHPLFQRFKQLAQSKNKHT